jgi:hypothetical protein
MMINQAMTNTFKTGLCMAALFFTFIASAQEPTYTVDQSFDSGELFRAAGGVADFHYLADGKILVGGRYFADEVDGIARIYPDGAWDTSYPFRPFMQIDEIIPQEDGFVYCAVYGFAKLLWDGTPWIFEHGDFWSDLNEGGTFNPYLIERVYDIHQMENGDLLLAGAIGTDTLQPGVLRGLARLTEDGTHDTTLPAIDLTPNNAGAAIRKIYPAPEGGWYVSGGFTALNGHETNHVAKLTEEFAVDTEFVSPFMYDGPVPIQEDIILVDDLSRVWVSGYQMRLLENPEDSIQIIRLLPDGEVDESFLPRELRNEYPQEWPFSASLALYAQELISQPDQFLIYGSFSHFDEVVQPCITVVDDSGEIQENYFQNMGPTVNTFNGTGDLRYPVISVVDQLENGDLLIGGAFSDFMGYERYSLVRLNQGFVGTEDQKRNELNIYPNPATDHIFWNDESVDEINIYNSLGQLVLQSQLQNGENFLSVEILESGFYVVVFKTEDTIFSQKLILK